MDWWASGIVALVCVVAIVTDARHHRIPNWLTFPAMGAGIVLNALAGWEGFLRSLGGLVMALLFLLPFFALGLFKAGDVKLVMAWGAIKGLGQPAWQSFALWAFLYGALFGGVIASLLLVTSRARAAGWQHTKALLGLLLGGARSLPAPEASPLRVPMPYGIPLGLGAFLALWLEWRFGSVCPFLQ